MCSVRVRALGGSAVLILALATPAWAEPRLFDIPAEDAGKSIPELARQAGIQIIAPGKALHGVTTPAVKGRFEIGAALAILLKGTRLSIATQDSQTIILAAAQPALPTSSVTEEPPPLKEEAVIVTGSQIAGSKMTGALPVTFFDESAIAAIAPVDGNDFIRSIPQMGAINFNSSELPGSSNSARGDVSSINLRGLGEGNTLLLMNGRRVAVSPQNQAAINLVAPAITYNSNAIPMGDVQHFEVLLDGASALYGSDAVAGVINVITNKDMQDARLGVSAGGVDGTHYNTSTVTLLAGHDFFGGRANVTASFTWTQETALFSADQAFTATANKAGLFANTGYAGLTSLNFTNATSPWGTFTVTPAAAVNSGAASLTTSSGTFHIQPALNAGCAYNLAGGTCIGAGPQATSTTALNTRSDPEAAYPITITPAVNRYNFFSNARYDVSDSLTLYAEAGWYQAETTNLQPPTSASGSSTLTIPASNYWSPFGPVTFDNGQTNPNRLPGLNIPASGSAVTITSYQFADQGTNVIRDWGHQGRILLGAKGEMLGFHWDSALLYSDAANRDVGQGINTQQLQANLALSTPAAYNPFLGGNASNPGGAVTNTANAAALQSFTSRYQTDAYSTLALWDFKASRADLFSLPAGDVGMALGLEARHEFMSDMRDPTINGMTRFTDTVTGATTVSDELGVSQTPNTHGERWVESAYAEVAVPLVSPEMKFPLMERLDLQIAGRVENFSDVGGVGKPKFAFSWDVVDSLRIRGSWAQGFEAPNLIQEHETLLTRSNTNTDYVLCAADLASGRINNFANCSEAVSVTSQRYGNTGLKPQTSDSKSIGMVFQPTFVPAEFGNVILTGDYWEILEKNLIGVFGPSNALILDYALREQGSSNPNVVRAAPTVTQVAQFAGTGLTPVGTLLYVNDQYVNLNRQSARGIDLTAHWDLRDTDWGSFSVDANIARMIGLYLQPSPVQQQLLNYKASGVINAGTAISTFGNLLQQNSNPKMRWTLTPTWNFGPLTLGGQIIYTGQVYDTALINTSNVPFRVPSQTTGNVYAEWNFADGFIGNGTKVRVGARNVSNAAPPPFLNAYGFIAGLYEPYGRYTYVSLTKRF